MGSADPEKILVVRLSAMGDVVHALPAVATLKHSFPGAHLTWVVEPRWAVLLRDNPFVDRVVTLEKRPWRNWNDFCAAWRDLRRARFDLAIDFQGLLKSALVAAAARPKCIVGFDRELLREKAAGLFYSQRVRSRARHVVDLNLDLVAGTGANQRRVVFPLPECPAEGNLPDSDFVLASPIAGWTAKQWPPTYYAQLAGLLGERSGWPLVINCAPGEQQEAEAIVEQAPKQWCMLNVSSVGGLIGVTRRAVAVVGVDSGPLHVAAALARPGVALFGPTDPARNGPFGDTFTVLRSPDAVTTYKRERSIAPSMWALEPQQVFQALQMQISRNPVLEPHQ